MEGLKLHLEYFFSVHTCTSVTTLLVILNPLALDYSVLKLKIIFYLKEWKQVVMSTEYTYKSMYTLGDATPPSPTQLEQLQEV